MLKACDELSEYTKNRKCNADTWWWNSWVKDEIQKKEVEYKEMKNNPTKETKNE